MKLNFDRIVAILGITISILSIIENPESINFISVLIFAIGIILAFFGLRNIIIDTDSSYKHLDYSYTYIIPDNTGKIVHIRVVEKVKLKKKIQQVDGNGWDPKPINLKVFKRTYKRKCFRYKPNSEFKLKHSNPEKRGAAYWWDCYHEPPAKQGDIYDTIYEFDIKNVFNKTINSDSITAFRKIKKFTWKIQFPKDRPAKRWWVYANFLVNKPDEFVIFKSNKPTYEINYSLRNLKKGAIYFIKWEW